MPESSHQVGPRSLDDILAAVMGAEVPQSIDDVQRFVPLARKRISWALKYLTELGRLHKGQVLRGDKWVWIFHHSPVADERGPYEARIAEMSAAGLSQRVIAQRMGISASFVHEALWHWRREAAKEAA